MTPGGGSSGRATLHPALAGSVLDVPGVLVKVTSAAE